MKTDIDQLMQTNGVDALLITGAGQHNPYMVYLTGIRHLTSADLLIKRGAAPLLFHAPMERDEAARSGLQTRSYNDYPLEPFLRRANNNRFDAVILKYKQMLSDAGVNQGKILLYGQAEIGNIYSLLSGLQKALPGLEFAGDIDGKILPQAMMTKDDSEIERIRSVGKITVNVVGKVADYLAGHQARNDVLIKSDGDPLLIGDVKRQINLWLAESGLENPEGTIFSIGRDSGVPHSSGIAGDPLRLGQTIVFDIFPCEAGGGYFYDFTRTWCLGFAPDETAQLYEEVRSAYDTISRQMKANQLYSDLQAAACDFFEARGHPTIRNQQQTAEGYVHSIGHGVGLKVHERPFSGSTASADDFLTPGVVFTIEPGLYYPERGLGVRLEDTVCVLPGGKIEVMAPYPMDLVLPVK